jgi:hypothetical protein
MNRILLLLSSCAALVASGCSDSVECGEGTHGDGTQCVSSLSPACGPGTKLVSGECVPDSGGGAECGVGTHSENGTCVPNIDVSGNASRFYDVSLTDPAQFVPITGSSFHDSFVSGDNLLFVGSYAPATNGMRIFGGGGTLNADGSYTLDHAHAYDTTAIGSGTQMSTAPFTFSMKAFGAPQYIVLVDTVITNVVTESPDGVPLVKSGHLSGTLTPENATNVYLQDANSNLYELILSLEIPPTVDYEDSHGNPGPDGVKESYTFGVTFETVPVWLF